MDKVFIYSTDGQYVKTIADPEANFYDVAWLKSGNILLADKQRNRLMCVTREGDVIYQSTQLSKPRYCARSADGSIVVTDMDNGVFQSTDHGMTWSHEFQSTDGWLCIQAISVMIADGDEVFWARGYIGDSWGLRIFRVTSGTVVHQVVSVPQNVAANIKFSRLSYDGRTTMLLADLPGQAVYKWSVDGQYEGALLTSEHVTKPCRIAVDEKRGLLYVGQLDKVRVFQATYDSSE